MLTSALHARLQGYNIIQLFLIANLLTTTSTLPVLAGLIRHRLAYRFVTATSMLVGCAFGLSSLFWWAAISRNRSPVPETYSQVGVHSCMSLFMRI